MYNYKIFVPEESADFCLAIEDLQLQIAAYVQSEEQSGRHLVYSKVFLSDIQNEQALFTGSLLYTQWLQPANCTLVGQAPANGKKMAVLVKTAPDNSGYLFKSMRLSDDDCVAQSSYLQTMALLSRYAELMKEKGMNLADHLLRTWIYVTNIDMNYEGVVKARNDFFRQYGLTPETHFVASTGIGGYSATRQAKVAIDFLTAMANSQQDFKYLQALDHLNPTHEYGVAFERGTRITLKDAYQYFISGTASIDSKGNVLYLNNVLKQINRLIENIRALLADGDSTLNDVKYFIVYLRDFSDYNVVESYMRQHFPHVPRIILHAKVCRPQWLIEMECVAVKEQ